MKKGSLDELFRLAGKERRFVIGSYENERTSISRRCEIKASSRACEFMMEAARKVGDLMDATRDHAETVERLRQHEDLIAEISHLCADKNATNALSVIAMKVAQFK